MKKLMIWLFTIMMVLSVPINTMATSNMDSRYLTEEEMEILDSRGARQENWPAIKIYGGCFIDRIAEGIPIAEIIANKTDIGTYYALLIPLSDLDWEYPDTSPDDYAIFAVTLNQNSQPYTYFVPDNPLGHLYDYIGTPEIVFEPSVEIYTVYCLYGSIPDWNMYVYYETSEGNYVLYVPGYNVETLYLIPEEELQPIAAEYCAGMAGGAIGGIVLEDSKLEAYRFPVQIPEPELDPNPAPETPQVDTDKQIKDAPKKDLGWILPVLIGVTVVVVFAGIVVWILLKKKRTVQ